MGPGALFHFDVLPINLIIRACVVYGAVLFLLRISGKRQVGQMGATEFVAVLLISNAVQNSMNGGDNSLIGGLLLATVLIILSTAISVLTYRSRFFERLFEGIPRVVVHEGHEVPRALKRERLTSKDLRILLRKQGVDGAHEVKSAILESDGTLSIIRYSDLNPSAAVPRSVETP